DKCQGAAMILVSSLAVIGALFVGERDRHQNAECPPYAVIEEMRYGDSVGSVIVVESKHVNSRDLSALGKRVHRQLCNERYAVEETFDSAKPARRRYAVAAGSIAEDELAFHNAHFLGTYVHNPLPRFSELLLQLEPPPQKRLRNTYGP